MNTVLIYLPAIFQSNQNPSSEPTFHRTPFLARGPALDGEDKHLPRHQQAHQAHGHGVHEHSVKLVMNHSINRISGLL